MIDGQIRPVEVKVTVQNREQKRWLMVYQQPGSPPLPLCEPKYHTSLQARNDAGAKKWAKRIQLEGHMALEELRAEVRRKIAEEKAREEAAKAAGESGTKELARVVEEAEPEDKGMFARAVSVFTGK